MLPGEGHFLASKWGFLCVFCNWFLALFHCGQNSLHVTAFLCCAHSCPVAQHGPFTPVRSSRTVLWVVGTQCPAHAHLVPAADCVFQVTCVLTYWRCPCVLGVLRMRLRPRLCQVLCVS